MGTFLAILLVVILVVYLYNNGKEHTMVDPDVHSYYLAQTDTGEWVNFPTIFKLTGNNDIIISTPNERILVLNVIEIEPNTYTGTLASLGVFTTVFMSDEKAYFHIMGNTMKNYK